MSLNTNSSVLDFLYLLTMLFPRCRVATHPTEYGLCADTDSRANYAQASLPVPSDDADFYVEDKKVFIGNAL